MHSLRSFTSLALLASVRVKFSTALSLSVSVEGGNKSSPILYGAMFEDINQSGDGGIYAELIHNRAFQGSSLANGSVSSIPTTEYYNGIGAVALAIDSTVPLSPALPNALSVEVRSTASGQVGFENTGFWGIPIRLQIYHASFYAYGAYTGSFQVSLKSNTTGQVYATTSVTAVSNSAVWNEYTARLVVSKNVPGVGNVFEVTFDANSAARGKMRFNLISLFPATYNNRINGLRPDLMNALGALKPSFLRWPGGNNLEGETIKTRWRWNNTLGPLISRPGRPGTWGYPNTDGLGMIEYLLWTQDLGMKNLYAVWDGLALDAEIVTGNALEAYIQDALNSIEFIRGDKSTTYGKIRVGLGYPEPFELEYVEIGNEDFLSGGLASYAQRFTAFYDALSSAYPDIQYIASTSEGLPTPYPHQVWSDIHYYLRPDGFYTSFNLYDNWDRTVPTMIGEYACVEPNDPNLFNAPTNWTAPITEHFYKFPALIGSVAEAIFMIGCERNSDVVKAMAYAPALQNLNNYQWTPNMLAYTADPAQTVLSTSYYVQQMFSTNRGSTILPVTATGGGFDPSFWVASRDDATGQIYVKLAHYSAESTTVIISVPGVTTGNITTLGDASEAAFNSVQYPYAVTPYSSTAKAVPGGFEITLPAWSVVVVAFK